MSTGAVAIVAARFIILTCLEVLLTGGIIPPAYVCMVFRQNYNRSIDGFMPAATVLMRAPSWAGGVGELACRKLPWSHDLTCHCAA